LQEIIARDLCRNMAITSKQSKRLIVARSTLCDQIDGLYCLDPISKDDFIIEYTGKLDT